MYLLQVMFGLSDEGTEDAILDSRSMQRFMHLDLMSEQVPDATTLAKFRHSLERRGLGKACASRPEFRAREGRDHGAGWLYCGRDLHLGLKASRRTRTMRATLKAHQSKKGGAWRI